MYIDKIVLEGETLEEALVKYQQQLTKLIKEKERASYYQKLYEHQFSLPGLTNSKSKTPTLSRGKIRVFNSRWTSDEKGNQKITKANLGDTVYFHTDLTGYPEGAKLDFKLIDYDDRLGFDILKWDDDKFPKEEVHKKTKVKTVNGKKTASVPLLLDPSWEAVLKSDTAYDIELYWEIHYKTPLGANLRAKAPKEKSDFLKVDFSNRTLYFAPSINGGKLPQMYTADGSKLFLVKIKEAIKKELDKKSKGEINDLIKKGVKKGIASYNNAIENKVINIALVKLSNGAMVDHNGKIHTKSRKLYEYTEEVFGKELKVVRGKGFKGTKGINQTEYFASNGSQVEFLNAMRINPAMDIDLAEETLGKLIDLGKLSNGSLKEMTSQPIKMPNELIKRLIPKGSPTIGVELWLEFLNYLALKEHKTQEAIVNKEIDRKLKLAKSKGLEAVRKFLYTYESNYHLEPISNLTLSKMLLGKFKTFQEMIDFNINQNNFNTEVLVKTIPDDIKGETFVIDSIFFNY